MYFSGLYSVGMTPVKSKPDLSRAAKPALEDTIVLGKAIAKARRASSLTQQQLCKNTGIAYSTLTKIERGAIKKPNVFTVLQIARATGMEVEELLDFEQNRIVNPYTASRTAAVESVSKPNVKFVYFDLHQVLVNSLEGMLPFLAADTGQPLLKVEEIFMRFDRGLCLGEVSLEQFDQAISEELGKPGLQQEKLYVRHVEADIALVEILELVSQRVGVGLLTNAFPGNVAALTEHKIIPEKFDVIVDSSAVGKIKPAREIYEYAQQQAGCAAEQILLIDDRLINIVGAEACGWQGFWLNDESRIGLRERLQEVIDF